VLFTINVLGTNTDGRVRSIQSFMEYLARILIVPSSLKRCKHIGKL
jgi:hypothetical protein